MSKYFYLSSDIEVRKHNSVLQNTFYSSCQQVLAIFRIHLHNVIKRYLSNSGACFKSNKEKHEKMRCLYRYICMYVCILSCWQLALYKPI